ncbi:hypothetical protein LH51_07375 [Nitrincola sp. A-D6]|nr:hypothetical protein LH51_07375 [Nitrincola sp. A-D6]
MPKTLALIVGQALPRAHGCAGAVHVQDVRAESCSCVFCIDPILEAIFCWHGRLGEVFHVKHCSAYAVCTIVYMVNTKLLCMGGVHKAILYGYLDA